MGCRLTPKHSKIRRTRRPERHAEGVPWQVSVSASPSPALLFDLSADWLLGTFHAAAAGEQSGIILADYASFLRMKHFK